MDDGSASSGYTYDFFISYHGETFESGWVQELLLPILKSLFLQECGREPTFVDFKKQSHGVDWQKKLWQCLAHSRCILPLWCSSYFTSQWCMWELDIMMKREERLGLRSQSNPMSQVVPILVADGGRLSNQERLSEENRLPDSVTKLQYLDIRGYVYEASPAFLGSPKYLIFQDKLRAWVPEAYQALVTAPEWQSSWLSDEMSKLPKVSKPGPWNPMLDK